VTVRSKYIKPKSLAWWASVAPLFGGFIIALSTSIPELQGLAKVVQEMAGSDMTAARLIQLGALGIGIRGSMP
jgi:hypothetical protein